MENAIITVGISALKTSPWMGWFYAGCFFGFEYLDWYPKKRARALAIAAFLEWIPLYVQVFDVPFLLWPFGWSLFVFLGVVLYLRNKLDWQRAFSTCLLLAVTIERKPVCPGPDGDLAMVVNRGLLCNESSVPAIEYCQVALEPYLDTSQMQAFAAGEYCNTDVQLYLIELCTHETYDACSTKFYRSKHFWAQLDIATFENCNLQFAQLLPPQFCVTWITRYKQRLHRRIADGPSDEYRAILQWLLDK